MFKSLISVLFCSLLVCGCKQKESFRTYVKNAAGEKIFVEVNGLDNRQNGKLIFLQHGLGTSHKDYLVQYAKEIFMKNGFTVVSFDNRHALGKK